MAWRTPAGTQTPHVGGTLVSYRLEGGRFRETQRAGGVSNHAIGSRAMHLAAFVDINGDGVPEVIVPSPDRSMLRAITFVTGKPVDLAQIALPSPASGDFEFHPPFTLLVPVEDGRTVRIVWR